MEKSQKLFLSIIFVFLLSSCQTKEEKVKDAYDVGFRHYQGSRFHMNAFAYALELDSTKAETYRELSVTYLKRGIPHKWKSWYDGAVEYDPITWQPWRGYLYLWFYRDYEKAIADFNASDSLTPYLDYPQGHSVDFWRGIAYLGAKDYENSIVYWDKHITRETEDSGEDWVELEAFLYRGIAYYESDNIEKANENFDKVIQYFTNSADAKYYKAQLLRSEGDKKAALNMIEDAIVDFNNGYYNNRAYVETLRQIYLEDLEELKSKIIASN
ncbi:tetratricopeptide repeat protein [Maribacter sp. M208]|uniref:tetratricopeptide repeat protein n=1 Tax=Maribacter huludaoensis TaxID=3030010 RepID=UPI0023EA8A88|nr:tetratricopeptide repeat protein [Maribacter huludaoensis]MDF4219985.1 tetratricopeptide repeat protein [Maribacter huludaoensis]